MSIEWSLVFFTLFVGLAAGTFIIIAFSEWTGSAVKQVRFPGAVLTLVALAIGGVSSVLHLGHPERIFGALEKPGSGIFMEALLIGIFGLIVIFYMLALRRGASNLVCKLLATLGAIPAIWLAIAMGLTYAMPSRPAWDTGHLTYLYLASAIMMGYFCMTTLLSGLKGECRELQIDILFSFAFGLQMAATVLYISYLAKAPYPDVSRSAARVLIGDLAPLFWIGVVLLGILVPGFIMQRAKKSGSLALARYGLMCVLIGGIAFRAMMFSLGSAVRNFFS